MHARHNLSARCTYEPLRLLIFYAIVCGCSTVLAAGGAHEHGAAELRLSSEGKDVQVTFNSPAQSLVGFETAAVTAEQKAAVERAEAILMAPNDLFVLEGNSCVLIEATVDVSSIMGVGNAPLQPKKHTDHADEQSDLAEGHADHLSERLELTAEHAEHVEEHADDPTNHDEDRASASDDHTHENHYHDDDGDASDADSHSDVSAAYTFECESDEALTRINFQRGVLPFGLERIDVLWVADWGQGAGQATPQSLQVKLRN